MSLHPLMSNNTMKRS